MAAPVRDAFQVTPGDARRGRQERGSAVTGTAAGEVKDDGHYHQADDTQ